MNIYLSGYKCVGLMDVVASKRVEIDERTILAEPYARTEQVNRRCSSDEEMVTNGGSSINDADVVISSDSSKHGFWHAHEYSSSHTKPTPFTINDILGWGKSTEITDKETESDMDTTSSKSVASSFGEIPILSIPFPRTTLIDTTLKPAMVDDQPLNLSVAKRSPPSNHGSPNNTNSKSSSNNNNGNKANKRAPPPLLGAPERYLVDTPRDVLLPNDVIIPTFKTSQSKQGMAKNGGLKGKGLKNVP